MKLSEDDCLSYFNCLTKDCTDGPIVEGRPCVGVSLSSLFPQLVSEANAWSRFGNEFARVAERVPINAAAAVAAATVEKRLQWADTACPADGDQPDWS